MLGKGKVLIVIHDLFQSYFEFTDFYEETLKSLVDTKIVLFNYPGTINYAFINNS